MISVIICSANPDRFANVIKNIEQTIGVPYEVLAFDNSIRKKGICEVYNQEATKARYDILCFIHEDIVIHTNGWGRILTNVLTDQKIGLAGVSGTVFKSKYPASWSACENDLYRTHSIQHYNDDDKVIVTETNPDNLPIAEVVVIDGVFMATKSTVFENFKFDEALLKGFHGYDIDYSFQAATKYKVVVVYGILLEHLSSGNLNREWLDASIKVHHKWKRILPQFIVALTKEKRKFNDYLAIQCVLAVALKYKAHSRLIFSLYLKMITKYFKYNRLKFSKKLFLFLIRK